MTETVVHRFAPRGAALELMRCRAPEILIAGPAGTGKSRAALEKLHMICLLTPKVRCLLLRKKAVDLAGSGIATYEKYVAQHALLDGTVNYFGGSQREAPSYRYSNGSSITVGGLDNPMKVMSTEYDVIFAQEATEFTPEDWQACITRLRNGALSVQQLLADCNPQHPTHWLKLRCESGATLMLHSQHEDNPRYFTDDGTMTPEGVDYVGGKLESLSGVQRLRLRDGIWAAAEGVIFEEFRPAIHVVDRFDPPESWPKYNAIDFGYVHPFVWQDWTEEPDGRLLLVREIFMTGRMVEDHARQIRALMGLGPIDTLTGRALPYKGELVSGWYAKKPQFIVCDHDAEDRATLARHLGLSTIAANKNVKDGLNASMARYRLDGRGKPRIGFMRDATIERDPALADARKPASTVEEIPGYIWNGKGKDEPVKLEDDGCDTKRYLIMERDVQPRPRIRWVR